jgi:alpha-glucosidase
MDHYPEVLELHVIIPEEDGEFHSQLHEDDGISDAHEQGRFVRTTFCLTRKCNRVHLTARAVGDGFPEFRRKRLHAVLRGCPVERIEINGVEARTRGGRVEFENSGEAFELSLVVQRAGAAA